MVFMKNLSSYLDQAATKVTCVLWGAFTPTKRDSELSITECVKARVQRTVLVVFGVVTLGIPHYFTYLYLGRKINRSKVHTSALHNPVLANVAQALYRGQLLVVPKTPVSEPTASSQPTVIPETTQSDVLPQSSQPVIVTESTLQVVQKLNQLIQKPYSFSLSQADITQCQEIGRLLANLASNPGKTLFNSLGFDFYINLVKALKSAQGPFQSVAQAFQIEYRGGAESLISDDESISACLLSTLLQKSCCKAKLACTHITHILQPNSLRKELQEKYRQIEESFNKPDGLHLFLVTVQKVELEYLSSYTATPIATNENRRAMFLRAVIKHQIN